MEQGLEPETAADILADTVPGLDEIGLPVRDHAVAVTGRFQYIRDSYPDRLEEQFPE